MTARPFEAQVNEYVEDRADGGFGWTPKFALAFNGTTFQVTIRIELVGDAPGAALGIWDHEITSIWANRGFFSDGTRVYQTDFDAQFVTQNAYHTVTVHDAVGRADMNNWYLQPEGWGTSYLGTIGAHEFGHMFGLFDEYAGGATYGNVTYDTGLMANLDLSGWERYFWTVEHYAETYGGDDLSLLMPTRLDDQPNQQAGTGGQDVFLGLGGNDALRGADGGDWLDGGAADDTVDGGTGADQLLGGSGNDTVLGGGGKDRLFGGDGDDLLDGNGAADRLSGGAGADEFRFSAALVSVRADRIVDFDVADSILLASNRFGSLGTAVESSEFRLGSSARDDDDFLLFSQRSGKLFYDADADGGGRKVVVAILQDGASLRFDDFLIVA